ncbi:Ctr copper transporter family-domain-containing protein [Xylaria intraflava]|nr:Ctr copper transporter family-domain-containing protein [Xylaria intraflava]
MDHSHMDHGGMDHGDGGHGGHGGHGGGMATCNMNMLFTWDTTDLCIVFRQWHVTGRASLIFSLLAIVAICAGYEAVREAARKYELWLSNQEVAYKRIGGAGGPPSATPVSQPARIVKAVLLLFMTYNGYVMIAVAVGIGLGYYIFGSRTPATKETACH